MAIYTEHDDVLNSLQAALNAIGTLHPLDRPTTPPSRRQYANTLKLAREFIGQMESHVSLLATVSEDFFDGEYSWEEDSRIEDSLLDMTFAHADQREFSQNSTLEDEHQQHEEEPREGENEENDANTFGRPFSIQGLINNILCPKKLTFSKREDEALARLLLGYHDTSVPVLKSLLDGAMKNMGEWANIIDLAKDIDAEENLNTCLLKREQFLHENPHGENLVSFICHVLRTIHTLKFQFSWNGLSQNERSKYLDNAFEYLCNEEIQQMRIRTPQQKQDIQWKKMRKAFGKAYQRKTTTRNYVYHLYQKFGVGVLLDPTWTTPNEMKTGRSTSFGPILNMMLQQLEDRIDRDEAYPDLHQYLQTSCTRSLILLEQLFDAMELDSFWDYIEVFVEDFPPDN
ncbi:hypothetical protein E4T56_gene14093 [Termitomyces sp. T112]|nr:hypothetical protein C0989_001986 [Termitomyces sp. Mn162]KAG5727878.1 hypothetical protein E4T56_gene14093 [Termitomyces sp. T112]